MAMFRGYSWIEKSKNNYQWQLADDDNDWMLNIDVFSYLEIFEYEYSYD